jgi:hypothetical protein
MVPPVERRTLVIAALSATITFFVLQLLHHLVAGSGSDFRAVLRGARDLAMGQDIYGPALQFLGVGHLRDMLTMSTTPYVYPPPLAFVLRPLSALPPELALTLWDAINVSLLSVLFIQVVRLSQARTVPQLILVGVMYGFFPLDMGLGTGQVDLAISVLGLTMYLQYRSGHSSIAGAILALLTLIKPTIGILVVYFVLRRAWPAVVTFICLLLAGAAASIALVGAQVLWEYRTVAVGWANDFGALPLNESIHGLVLRLLAPSLDVPPHGMLATIATVVEAVVLLAAFVVSWWLLRDGEPTTPRRGALQFYAVFSLLLAGAPFTENIHLVWILPGVALLLVAVAQRRFTMPVALYCVGAYLLLATPLSEAIAWGAGTSLGGRIASGIECYGLIAVAAALCLAAFRRERRHAVRPALKRMLASRRPR